MFSPAPPSRFDALSPAARRFTPEPGSRGTASASPARPVAGDGFGGERNTGAIVVGRVGALAGGRTGPQDPHPRNPRHAGSTSAGSSRTCPIISALAGSCSPGRSPPGLTRQACIPARIGAATS